MQRKINAAEMWFPRRMLRVSWTEHATILSVLQGTGTMLKGDDDKHQTEVIAIPKTCDKRRKVGKCMCYRKNRGNERQRKTEAEIRGYSCESIRMWPASSGAPAIGALQNIVAEHGRQRLKEYITLVSNGESSIN